MPTIMNVNEARANFSGALTEVERKARLFAPVPAGHGKRSTAIVS